MSALILGAALLAVTSGCRYTCGDRPGWFTSHSRGAAPCHLTGNAKPIEGCFDPVSGQPVPCPPMETGTVIPGGAIPVVPGGGTVRPDELPYPSPSDLIRPPGVPYAPPFPAPGNGSGGEGASGAPRSMTTPVKSGANNK